MPAELLQAMQLFLDPVRMGFMLVGVAAGILFGVIPGTGAIFSVAILLTFVNHMDVPSAIAMIVGALAVVNTADSTASVLIGTPGSAASVPTAIEGYPMAKRGEAARALSAAYSSSLIGGLLGVVMLTLLIPFVRPLSLHLGIAELFMACILGLSLTSALIGNDLRKGVMMALFGLALGTIGPAPSAPVWRFTYGHIYLMDGLSLVIVAIGLFGMAEIISLLAKGSAISNKRMPIGEGWANGIRDVFQNWGLVLRGTLIGVWMGILPALGGIAGTLMAYAQTKAIAKDKSQFGKGDVRGIISPEASNNSIMAGEVIPTLFFSIPGSVAMALLMGFLLSQGIFPGPRFVADHFDLIYIIIWTLAISNIIGAAICFALTPLIAKVTFIPFVFVAPAVIMAMTIAAYQNLYHIGDLIALFVFGILGWLMKESGWPRAPLLIGIVLTIPLERYGFLTVNIYPDLSWLQRPIVLLLVVLTVLPFVGGWLRDRRILRAARRGERDTAVTAVLMDDVDAPVKAIEVASAAPRGVATEAPASPPPRTFTLSVFVNLLISGAFAWLVFDSLSMPANGRLVPLSVSAPGLLLGLLGIVWFLSGRRETIDVEDADPDRQTGEALAAERRRAVRYWIALAIYLAAIPVIGFYAATVIFMGFLLFYVARIAILSGLVYIAAILAVLYLGQRYLGLSWPTGMLF